ncbi:MAG: DUF2752 domain-containing protein [Melioribacteraceae bacterium]|nr:DUF2752 domain-containing protein [Melioribacteraceae bacterium]
MIKQIKNIDLELLFWVGGLIYLLLINPFEEQLFTLCPFHNLGIPCPGCGLGRSISFIYHGNFIDSFNAHPLGFFALTIILYRIVQLVSNLFNSYKTKNEVSHG